MREKVIYRAPKFEVQKKLRPQKRRLSWVANLLIFLALIGLLFSYGPLFYTEVRYRVKKEVRETAPKIGFGELLKQDPNALVMAVPDPNFSLVIPKIEAKSRIVANVDASDNKEYQAALKEGVAHAKGTVFPGMKGTIFLFAHSTDAPWNVTRYNAVFYLLRELEVGDSVIMFYGNHRFNYRVTDKKIVEPDDLSFWEQKDEELLVLQTCYPPGTTRNALLIFAQRDFN